MSIPRLRVSPRMRLHYLAAYACCTTEEAAFFLLELLAAGHEGKELRSLPEAEFCLLLDLACRKMDRLGVPF